MIISESHNFILIHVPKVAGASISDALKIYKRKNKRNILNLVLVLLSKTNSHLRNKLYELKYLDDGHLTASEIRNKLGFNKFEKFKKFAFRKKSPGLGGISLSLYSQYKRTFET